MPHASYTRMCYCPAAPVYQNAPSEKIWHQFSADFCSHLLHHAADSLTMSVKSNEKLRNKPKSQVWKLNWKLLLISELANDQPRSRHSSGCYSLVSHRGSPGSTQVKTCGICGRQRGTGEGFLRELRFPLLILFPSNPPYHPSSGVDTIGQLVADVPSWFCLTP
jgi:hypothetical protein